MARRRVSAGAASTPIHQIGIQGRTTKALHGCSVNTQVQLWLKHLTMMDINGGSMELLQLSPELGEKANCGRWVEGFGAERVEAGWVPRWQGRRGGARGGRRAVGLVLAAEKARAQCRGTDGEGRTAAEEDRQIQGLILARVSAAAVAREQAESAAQHNEKVELE
uniref:Uncharacterized protein n=1 Tax=Oryza rufipogon TaxID=4529 RepID=A0A0E0RCX6_ORYRU